MKFIVVFALSAVEILSSTVAVEKEAEPASAVAESLPMLEVPNVDLSITGGSVTPSQPKQPASPMTELCGLEKAIADVIAAPLDEQRALFYARVETPLRQALVAAETKGECMDMVDSLRSQYDRAQIVSDSNDSQWTSNLLAFASPLESQKMDRSSSEISAMLD